jgi:hypothetical protein
MCNARDLRILADCRSICRLNILKKSEIQS